MQRSMTKDAYKNVDAEHLTTMGKEPSDPDVMQEDSVEHWDSMVSAVKILKDMNLAGGNH